MVWVQIQNNSVPNWIPKKEEVFSQEGKEMRQGEAGMCIVGNGVQTFQRGKQTTEAEVIAQRWGTKVIRTLLSYDIKG